MLICFQPPGMLWRGLCAWVYDSQQFLPFSIRVSTVSFSVLYLRATGTSCKGYSLVVLVFCLFVRKSKAFFPSLRRFFFIKSSTVSLKEKGLI